MKNLPLLLLLFLISGCSPKVTSEFVECCATYRSPGFDGRLNALIRVGSAASDYQELLSKADKVVHSPNIVIYTFSDATGAFSEQGLVVFVKVDSTTKLISDVEWAVAAR